MQVVILAGGLGTRLSEETMLRPKPMIEIGGKPILWHILKHYSHHGFNDFIICCGYKGYMIKEFFSNYFLHISDVKIDIEKNKIQILQKEDVKWKITLVDTGENTQTGGRLARVKDYIKGDFCMTYGDGLSNINIRNLVSFHHEHKKLATVSVVKPPGRFGALNIDNNNFVKKFNEKPSGDGGYINGGFFVLNKKVIDFISGDSVSWESTPMQKLTKDNQLMAFTHDDFWSPMDTLRDKHYLEDLWSKKEAPWRVWG
jgi:glucose-1-phosphate cytidylyltransferase